MMRYAHALDRRDFAAVGEVFLPDASARFDGQPVGPGRDRIVEFVSSVRNTRLTAHYMMNQLIEIADGTGHMETYAMAHAIRSQDGREHMRVRGLRYVCNVVKADGRWYVSNFEHIVDWEREDSITR